MPIGLCGYISKWDNIGCLGRPIIKYSSSCEGATIRRILFTLSYNTMCLQAFSRQAKQPDRRSVVPYQFLNLYLREGTYWRCMRKRTGMEPPWIQNHMKTLQGSTLRIRKDFNSPRTRNYFWQPTSDLYSRRGTRTIRLVLITPRYQHQVFIELDYNAMDRDWDFQ